MSNDMKRVSFDAPTHNASVQSSNPKHASLARPSAVVYAEGFLGELDGKTANGLIRQSDNYEVTSVIDSLKAGFDAGLVLDGKPNGVPVFASLSEVLAKSAQLPSTFIFGIAPSSGLLSPEQRTLILDAISHGMNIVSGLHEFLSDDLEMAAAAQLASVQIIDTRRPPDKKDLHTFSGRINSVACPRIAILGTDCAIGKRTTATLMARALNDAGIHAVLVGTGQTSLIQGAKYGVALDAVPSQFCAGELEAAVLAAVETENPDIIIIEGQGALSHPAFSTTSFILRGSVPDGVVVQHAPGRKHRCDFPQMTMPSLVKEINLIETFSDTKVIGVTINHEEMSEHEVQSTIAKTERELGLPVCDPLTSSASELVRMVESAFPQLGRTELAEIG